MLPEVENKSVGHCWPAAAQSGEPQPGRFARKVDKQELTAGSSSRDARNYRWGWSYEEHTSAAGGNPGLQEPQSFDATSHLQFDGRSYFRPRVLEKPWFDLSKCAGRWPCSQPGPGELWQLEPLSGT